jgi:predicted secreted hydrolase
MMARFLLLACVMVLAGCEQPAPAQSGGFAGLGEVAEGFAEVRPGRQFQFPADHAAHPDYRIEWWYVTANLVDEEGAAWGVQWTLFRQALEPQSGEQAEAGWDSAQIWLGHAAVTRGNEHRYADRLGRGGVGQAGARAEPFEAWIDNWSLSSDVGDIADLQMTAAGDDFAYQLTLKSRHPLVFHGQSGYSRKSEGDQASYYYSQPFYEASGEIRLGEHRFRVSGLAWLDREWSSQPLSADQDGWDWFSLHLDSGEKVMLFRLRSNQGQDFYSGSWIDQEGRLEPLQSEQIRMVPLAETRVAGRLVPTHWRLEIPVQGLDITVRALNDKAWMGTGIPYWEGAVSFEGSHGGQGYLEMTGY